MYKDKNTGKWKSSANSKSEYDTKNELINDKIKHLRDKITTLTKKR
jgi:hypothetical protein